MTSAHHHLDHSHHATMTDTAVAETHESHSRGGTTSFARLAFQATLHCMTGCAIGEIAGMVIGTAIGLGMWAYGQIAARNRDDKFEVPIYVGKAVPAGARKGNVGLGTATGPVLWGRLKEHAEGIKAASSILKLEDLYCRLLIVDDIWIPLAESLLISKFSPVWNKRIDGFGNHDPGKGRYEGLRPMWDVLHPRRSWADKCQPRSETAAQIATDLKAYLKTTQIPAKPKLLG